MNELKKNYLFLFSSFLIETLERLIDREMNYFLFFSIFSHFYSFNFVIDKNHQRLMSDWEETQ